MEEDFEVEDHSGDRKYFTMVPNYILNHSTATAQALYAQLKRLAGDAGLAYPSRAYLMEKLGISKPTLLKELDYLVSKKWIRENGDKSVMTEGGMQKVRCYSIVDIWKLNVSHYDDLYDKGVKSNTPLDPKGVKNDAEGGKNSYPKGVKNTPPNKNHIIITNTNTGNPGGLQGDQWNKLIDAFKEVNPFYAEFYRNKTERVALQSLVSMATFDKVLGLITNLEEINSREFYPKSTKPTELKRNLPKLMAKFQEEKHKGVKKEAPFVFKNYNKK